MSPSDRFAEYHQQLETLEKHLKETTKRLQGAAPDTSEHEKEAEALHDKAAGFRTRLKESDLSTWETAKHELAAEWQALTHAFDRWTARVDARFKKE